MTTMLRMRKFRGRIMLFFCPMTPRRSGPQCSTLCMNTDKGNYVLRFRHSSHGDAVELKYIQAHWSMGGGAKHQTREHTGGTGCDTNVRYFCPKDLRNNPAGMPIVGERSVWASRLRHPRLMSFVLCISENCWSLSCRLPNPSDNNKPYIKDD